MLPAGSGPRGNYPSVRSWRLVLTALSRRWPEAVFCLLGKLRQDGRTATSFGHAELAELAAAVPASVNAVDLPIIDELAVVAACDVLVSPHTGFGMAALAVGTPWLSIAGNQWPEYYFNGVPFYSVLPDVYRFPAYTGLGPEPEPVDDDGPRSPSMCRERIEADRPAGLAALYALSGTATEEFNALDAEFAAAGSGIETVAREVIADDFRFIAVAYGFPDADVETLIARRDW